MLVFLLAVTFAAGAQSVASPTSPTRPIDRRLTASSASLLAPVAARIERCLRRRGLALSEANAPRLTSCVCAGPARGASRYCFVGNGFVAFSPGSLPRGIFRRPDNPHDPPIGLAYVPTPVTIPQEFDRNYGSIGPSDGPRARGWHIVGFCPWCD